MNFHEYQAKELFAQYGIPVPYGRVATTVEGAVESAREISGEQWVVKAQVHAGGRGKAGGIKLCKTLAQVREAAQKMLGSKLETYQTAGRALPVNQVLICEATDIRSELYLSILVDRAERAIVFIGSPAGGVDIEQVARDTPEKIHTLKVDFLESLQPYQCREFGTAMGLKAKQNSQLTKIMLGMYKLFNDYDLAQIELNPLIISPAGDLLALDGKVSSDDNGLFRQEKLKGMRDVAQEDPLEARAAENDLNYVSLDGDIACMVNGAGLAMATMDVIKLYGAEPANFLDVGGTANAARVTEALKLILSNDKVKAILINIFGGIVKCDLIAEGVITAVKEVGLSLPVVVRLEGTNADRARELLKNSNLPLIPATDLSDAAEKVVAAVRQA
jgi:succinyl-CoA synthetase beta subunit